MRKSSIVTSAVLFCFALLPALASCESPTAPPYDPPQIVVTAGVDDAGQLLLVNFRTIYIGFSGESYNDRSVSKVSLQDVRIVTIAGKELSLDETRKWLARKETPILCSSWETELPPFYQKMFMPDTLHFVFPKQSPIWQKIQEPGRPLR